MGFIKHHSDSTLHYANIDNVTSVYIGRDRIELHYDSGHVHTIKRGCNIRHFDSLKTFLQDYFDEKTAEIGGDFASARKTGM